MAATVFLGRVGLASSAPRKAAKSRTPIVQSARKTVAPGIEQPATPLAPRKNLVVKGQSAEHGWSEGQAP